MEDLQLENIRQRFHDILTQNRFTKNSQRRLSDSDGRTSEYVTTIDDYDWPITVYIELADTPSAICEHGGMGVLAIEVEPDFEPTYCRSDLDAMIKAVDQTISKLLEIEIPINIQAESWILNKDTKPVNEKLRLKLKEHELYMTAKRNNIVR